MIIHSLSRVKDRLIFINRGCKSHLKNSTKVKWKLYLFALFILWDSGSFFFCVKLLFFKIYLLFGNLLGNILLEGVCIRLT